MLSSVWCFTAAFCIGRPPCFISPEAHESSVLWTGDTGGAYCSSSTYHLLKCCCQSWGHVVCKTNHRKYGPQEVALAQSIPNFVMGTVTLVFYLAAPARRLPQALQWHLFQQFTNALFANVFFLKLYLICRNLKRNLQVWSYPFMNLFENPLYVFP